MLSRTRHLGLAAIAAALWLVCASGVTVASSREAVHGAGLMRSVTASTALLASTSSTACFDLATDSVHLTYVFVDSGCVGSPSDVVITVDGLEATELYTDGGPCESIPRDVWFPLQANQEVLVCVSVQGDCPAGIQVHVEAGSACTAGAMP
jgi:hypothetical protein